MNIEYYLNEIDLQNKLFKDLFLKFTENVELNPKDFNQLEREFKNESKKIFNEIIKYKEQIYNFPNSKNYMIQIDNKISSINDVLRSVKNPNKTSFIANNLLSDIKQTNSIFQEIYENCSYDCIDIDAAINEGMKIYLEYLSKKDEVEKLGNEDIIVIYNKVKYYMMIVLLNLINNSLISEYKRNNISNNEDRYNKKMKILSIMNNNME